MHAIGRYQALDSVKIIFEIKMSHKRIIIFGNK